MRNFGLSNENALNLEIVEGLIRVLDDHNGLVRLFRTARDRCSAAEILAFKIRLYNKGGVCGYELPTSDVLGAIVFEDGPKSRTYFDVIIEFRGFYLELMLKPRDGRGKGKKVTMNAYYKYQLHTRVKDFGLLFRDLYIIEFQKRGLPHCHTLLWVDSKSKIHDAVQIDGYISAEIPGAIKDPTRYKVATELMMHGPYGAANLGASCMQKGSCNKHFPKIYNEKTFFDTNGHTQYRRGNTDFHVMKGESRLIGEASTSTCDKRVQVDEIQNYVDGHFVFPFEACWGIFDFPIHSRGPAMQILNVHLENMQRINFRETDRRPLLILATCHQKGCKSPVKVRTVNNKVFPTYRAVCEALDPLKLWKKHLQAMRDDIPAKVSETIISSLRSQGKIVLVVASSGIVSLLLPAGRTTHSRKMLRSLTKWLLDVGNGEAGKPDQEDDQDTSWISIPPEYYVTPDENGLSELIDFIYDDTTLNTPTAGALQEKVIGCPKNDTVDAVNARILSSIEGVTKIYLSMDEAIPMGKETGKESEFPKHHFEFTAYNQLSSNIPYRDENAKMIYPILTDYLGCIRSISNVISSGDANTSQKYRRKVDIKNLDENIVEFSMWDALAKQFNKEEIQKLSRPVIIAVSSCRVTKYKDVQLAATPATYYYINPQTREAENAYTM
nr:DNA helicase [Tanacetum cinerariifolium]